MVLLKSLGLAPLLLLASCWTPVFNQDLSVAALIRDKLDLDQGLTFALNSGGQDDNLYQAALSHDGSVLGIVTSNHNEVRETIFSGAEFSHSLDFPLTDASQVVLQPSGPYVTAFVPTITNGSLGRGVILRLESSNTETLMPYPDNTLAEKTDLIGFSAYQTTGFVIQNLYLTASASGTNLLLQTGPLGGTPTTLLSGIPYPRPTPGWLAVDLGGPTIFFTHAPNTAGIYLTDVIDASGVKASWKGRDHVVAFLSTRRLLTREGSFYNVCDASGKILYSFPAGTLKFAGEYVDPITFQMRTRFTEALLIPAGDGGGQDKVRVKLYSISSAKLDTLQ